MLIVYTETANKHCFVSDFNKNTYIIVDNVKRIHALY